MFWVIWLTNRVFWVTKKVFWIRNRVFSAIWLMFSIFSIFSLFSKIAPCSPIRCGRIPQFVEPCLTGLSSPGLRAESARAVTGRRWPTPQWGGGRLFEPSTGFFYENCCNGKSKNWSQGGKLTVTPRATKGSLTKIGVVWQKSDFLAKNRDFGPKKNSLLNGNHVLATTGKSCS